jgi:hypothetical protein
MPLPGGVSECMYGSYVRLIEYHHLSSHHKFAIVAEDFSSQKTCLHTNIYVVTFKVFTAVTMKNEPGSSLADFSTLNMEAICSSETSVHTRSTRRHIPEDGILQHLRRSTVILQILPNFWVPVFRRRFRHS